MKPNPQEHEPLGAELDALFVRYRSACPDVEPSAQFMPNIWAKIDAQRGWLWHLRVYANRMAVGAAAACMLMAGLHFGTSRNGESLLTRSYVDVLQDSAATEDYAYVPVLDQGGRSE